jgi:hypothetical protein
VIANALSLQQHFQSYSQPHHHFAAASDADSMMQQGGGYMMERLKAASSLAGGLYDEDERGKAPSLDSGHGYEGGENGSGKMTNSYEDSMAMLPGSCYSDRL